MIKVIEIFREACRNISTGAARPLIAMFALAAVIGSLGCVQVIGVVQVNRDAVKWRSIGASTQIVSLPGKIDGARCAELGSIPGIAASGAVRSGQALQFAALPSSTFMTLEGTSGLALVLGVQHLGEARKGGIWVSSDLAMDLGADDRPDLALSTTEGNSVTIAGQYDYPEDGRLPLLAYNAISEVPDSGVFDSCWIEIWPESTAANDLLTFPITSTNPDSQDTTPKIQQLNASEGTTFNGVDRLNRIPSLLILVASILAGAVIGFALVWIRRLELASALHAGISKPSLCLQTVTETAIYSTPAVMLSLSIGLVFATLDNPGSPWPGYIAGAGVIVAGASSALLGSTLATLAVSENSLFRYFKNR